VAMVERYNKRRVIMTVLCGGMMVLLGYIWASFVFTMSGSRANPVVHLMAQSELASAFVQASRDLEGQWCDSNAVQVRTDAQRRHYTDRLSLFVCRSS
jgi:hypothetical protein